MGLEDNEDNGIPRIGSAPYSAAPDMPWPNHRCGHCRSNSLLMMPTPESWQAGVLEPGAEERLRVVYRCGECGERTLVIYNVAARGDDNRARIVGIHGMYPPSAPEPLRVPEYRRSIIQAYRTEAWDCYWSDHHRGAVLMARSALQAACRRYLASSEWGTFGQEMGRLAEKAGPGWSAIAGKVKEFGNSLAHPDPSKAPVAVSDAEAKASLQRMDDILRFTAAMERDGHLVVLNKPPTK